MSTVCYNGLTKAFKAEKIEVAGGFRSGGYCSEGSSGWSIDIFSLSLLLLRSGGEDGIRCEDKGGFKSVMWTIFF